MNVSTIEKLNNINKDFYNKTAIYFDNSRNYFWKGWDRVLEELQKKEIKSVLDIGCGNGRFYKFLRENLKEKFEYLGIDSNEYLLNKAAENITDLKAKFIKADILADPLSIITTEKHKLIVLFGVLHHIPSWNKRLEILSMAKELLSEDGILVLSFWNFKDEPKLNNKIAKWEVLDIEEKDLEENDFLVGWDRGVNALRYCHYFSKEEINRIVETLDLKLISLFNAEGENENLNTYVILGN